MATSLKLRNDIKKYEAAIKSKATPAKFKEKLRVQLDKAKSQLESMKSSKAKKPSAPKKKSAIDKLKARYKGSGVDLKKDAERPALPVGKRKSKSGNTYYEYRLNRIDLRQPPKRYPKLEDGGYMAKGGETFELYDINGEKIEEGDVVKSTQPSGGILSPSEGQIGVVEKTKDAFGQDDFQIRFRKEGKNFDQFILLNHKINEIIN